MVVDVYRGTFVEVVTRCDRWFTVLSTRKTRDIVLTAFTVVCPETPRSAYPGYGELNTPDKTTGQKDATMGKKIYVGNLSYDTSESDLTELFQAHGNVVSVAVITDRDTGRSKGFGFVEMSSEEEAQAAINSLNGNEVDGRQLKVNESIERPRRNDNRY